MSETKNSGQSELPKVIYLTAGAAGMFCGSCMHDNALAKSLSKMGIDIQLVPTYTPIRVDEDDFSVDQVFFGGINVYLQQKIPLFRLVPRIFDRFLDAPWLIRRVASQAVNMKPAELGKLTVSMLKGAKGNQRKEVTRLCDWLGTESPDVVVLTNALIGGCVPDIKAKTKAKVIVTLQGDDVFLETLPEPYQNQCFELIRELANSVDGFIAHSEYYADFMADYLQIDREKIHVTPLGIDLQDFADWPERTSHEKENVTIGYFARLAPEKGLHLLVDAFIRLHQDHAVRNCTLHIAGWLGEHNREYAKEQFKKLEYAGLQDSYQFDESVDREKKLEFFRAIDLLSVPTTYREPKGLFALEAMAAGVPVVLPNHGAFPELIADTSAGLLCDPESDADLALKLAEIVKDDNKRIELGKNGYRVVRKRRDANMMAKRTIELL